MTDADYISRHARVAHPIAALVVMAANRIDVPVKVLRSDKRGPALTQARRWVIVQARSLDAPGRLSGHYSYLEIGRALNRDHSTVMEAERRAREAGL